VARDQAKGRKQEKKAGTDGKRNVFAALITLLFDVNTRKVVVTSCQSTAERIAKKSHPFLSVSSRQYTKRL